MNNLQCLICHKTQTNLTRMKGVKLLRQVFYSQYDWRPRHKPKKRFKNVEEYLMVHIIDIRDWKQMMAYRSIQKKVIYESSKDFEALRIEHCGLKLTFQNQDLTSVPDILQPDNVCNICRKICQSKAGHGNHEISWRQTIGLSLRKVLQQQPSGNSSKFSDDITPKKQSSG